LHIIKWTRNFELGIEEIDEQHRQLVAMINALDVNSHGDFRPETTRTLLAQLSDYVRDHFSLEERLMAAGNCDQGLVARHCGEHAYFSSLLKDLTSDFEHGRRTITVTLIEHLVHWLLHHIVVIDRAMVSQRKENEWKVADRAVVSMMKELTEELTDSERHLLDELRRANVELERELLEQTTALKAENSKLQADVREMSQTIAGLRAALKPQ
jgi:hemerythrin-like metal-binding protein